MSSNIRSFFTVLKHQKSFDIAAAVPSNTNHNHQKWRGIAKVRLKWVKNKSIDHIIDKETDVKAACLLKDAIKRSPTGFLTARSVADWQKLLGLTVPVLRFLRRYPTLFHEFPHSRYASLPCFRLTDTALLLDEQEQLIYSNHEAGIVEQLCRVLMMMKDRSMPLQPLHRLKWDLGLPDTFEKSIIPKYPDHFKFIKGKNGLPSVSLVQWRDVLALSALHKNSLDSDLGSEYRHFKRGQTALSFPMSFPRGYGAQKKVKAWMEEFQKLPYISPYEDSRRIDPKSELMEKRVVGVLHEFLSLTIHKKTKRNLLRPLRQELILPEKFTRIFTRYPGIFYLSLKCKTTTITLKEGYRRGRLINPHPLARLREKIHYIMKTGLLHRGQGVNFLSPEDCMLDAGSVNIPEQDVEMEEESESEEEFWEGEASDVEMDSDED